jgi:hypothetical protein
MELRVDPDRHTGAQGREAGGRNTGPFKRPKAFSPNERVSPRGLRRAT